MGQRIEGTQRVGQVCFGSVRADRQNRQKRHLNRCLAGWTGDEELSIVSQRVVSHGLLWRPKRRYVWSRAGGWLTSLQLTIGGAPPKQAAETESQP